MTGDSGPVTENYFDERIAATYEAKWPELFEPAVVEPAVSFLADLARSGTALELGIGTGRLALPLSQRGGPARRNDPARALERLESRALHQRQREPHLRLAEIALTAVGPPSMIPEPLRVTEAPGP